MSRSPLPAVVLAAAGGLLLAGSATAAWVVVTTSRSVGGLPVEDVARTSGVALAPLVVPLGVLACVAALALLAGDGVRRLTAAVLVVLGVAAAIAAAVGLGRALRADGTMTSAPLVALVGAALLVAGGVAGRRAARPALPSRYTVEAPREDDEWSLAADEDEHPAAQ
jgi:hypothetical protein